MEANDFSQGQEDTVEDSQQKRHSKRIRKPIKVYQPEFVQPKSKKHDYSINFKFVKSKGITSNPKNVEFSIVSNFTGVNISKKFMKATGFSEADHTFVFFCEKSKSNF